MKVHTLQIPVDGLHLEGEEDSHVLGINDPLMKPAGPIHYALDVGLSGGGIFATGVVGVDLDVQCVTCLEAFRFPLEVPEFACQVELEGRETVDLTEPVREDILLALPPHPHCDWNGERECPGAFHREDETASEPREEKREVWNALDQLKLQ
jgi:uncharacterized metal-binding protein YceD (DUF177 family)